MKRWKIGNKKNTTSWKILTINKKCDPASHPPPLRRKRWRWWEWEWWREEPLWLDPRCSNRNQLPDSGPSVFPCISPASAAWTHSDLTALHALSFNETIAMYACRASFTFLKPLYTNFDPCKLPLQHKFLGKKPPLRFLIMWFNAKSYVTNHRGGKIWINIVADQWENLHFFFFFLNTGRSWLSVLEWKSL